MPVIIDAITQIEYMDYYSPRVKIIDGGIGKSFAKLRILSRPGVGIKTMFHFHFRNNQTDFGQLNVENFLETNFHIEE